MNVPPRSSRQLLSYLHAKGVLVYAVEGRLVLEGGEESLSDNEYNEIYGRGDDMIMAAICYEQDI